MTTELTRLTIAEAADRLRRRALSPVELTDAYLARIQAEDGAVRAYITVPADAARAAAKAAETEIARGTYRGPLHGIPIGLKDIIQTKGVRTTCGSKVLAGWVPDADAAVVRRLADAGAVTLGKLNCHEFAFGPTGVNAHHGTPRNPWGADRMPGGSSSGSGAAVGAALCAGALGTDTGGSIRIPASLCGIVGLKPTYGRVSRAGVVPLAWSLDTIGPMARTVEDAALMLGALAGQDPADPASAAVGVPDYMADLRRGIRGLRIGVVRPLFFDHLDAGVRAAVEAAARALEGLGAAVGEVRLDRMVYAGPAVFAIISAEAMAYHEPLLRKHAPDYGPDVRHRLLTGQFVLATQYLKAQRARRLVTAEVDSALSRADALLLPSTPLPAPRVTDQRVAVDGVADDVRAWLTRCTRPFNLTGHPVLSIPCGLTGDGLPVGLSLVGRRFDESTLLRIGHAYEGVSPLRGRVPPLAP